MLAPKKISVSASVSGVGATDSANSDAQRPSAVIWMSRLQPNRLASIPITGMETIEPAPKQSSNSPNC